MKKQEELYQEANKPIENSRRNFIKVAGIGLAATTLLNTALPSAAHAQTNRGDQAIDETDPVKLKEINDASEKPTGAIPSALRPAKRIGYAIVGLGHLSLNQILPGMVKCKFSKPVALVSGDAAKAQKVALQYGINPKNIYNYQNFDEIKNNPEIDVVYIVLPNAMHEEFTVRAAKAGKHILCEKPMSVSSASAARMIAACKKSDRKLMIAYRIQYEPNSHQVMKWTRGEQFGKVRVIDAFNAQNIGDPEQWRLKKALSGGGSLPDIGLYNLNTSRFILGEEPEMVVASTYSTPGDIRFKEVEETVMFQLFFPSGAISNNTCSYGIHESRYYRCNANKGAHFGVDNAFTYNGLQLKLSQVQGKMELKSEPSLGPEKDQFTLEIDHMSDCVLHNKTPFTPGEEGLQDHKLMEAIYESARTQRPVKLEKITGLDVFRGTRPVEQQ
ncbi:Gfo/Idh/MocA family protein [Pedobacter sp. L105]|uniref:Gfo/Idh/MocA family protein n=1 Tax=Pedobacter sp. L105 TaxID=1641871 RepID=UPI00131ED0DF|nr:Gfo/Idh/MocA family oxidoreductase [Pedobacter sp. L105]